jgi:flagellum-specific ATP synthase
VAEAAADRYARHLHAMPLAARVGEVVSFNGLVIEAQGPLAELGELCELQLARRQVMAEVVGFRDDRVLLMPYSDVRGLRAGDVLRATARHLDVPVGMAFIGRVVDAFGEPIDHGPPVIADARYPALAQPMAPLARRDIDEVLETGVGVVDSMLTMGKGQRVGVFAGSGVGKSTLLGMMAQNTRADVIVLALVGERGREVGDFLEHVLGSEGRARSVVVAATSDQPALVRVHATHAAHAMAEFYRDRGLDVLLIVDSVTRLAMAQREIGLAAGEPPTTRGYPPSVFARLPMLVERGGALRAGGSITSVYSVLVEGDDMNEPVADHMRALLDGHIVLTRSLANQGRLPAVDVLQSASRLMGRLASGDERAVAESVVRLMASFEASRDLVDMGAHQRGANALLDQAVDVAPVLAALFAQRPGERRAREALIAQLAATVVTEARPI